MRKIVVIGNSGSGKTRLARELGRRLDLPFLELDGVYHQQNWTPLPKEEFRDRVARFVAADGWVIDGSYSAVRDIVWSAADTVVWLDLPRWVVTGQVVRRTVGRGLRREELWNGNREELRNLIRRDRNVNVVLWSWTNHGAYRARIAAAAADAANAHLKFVRLRSRAEVTRWLKQVHRVA